MTASEVAELLHVSKSTVEDCEVGYVNVAAFGKAGDACAEYLSKGWLVAVDGRLEYGEWETDGGEKRHDYSVSGTSSSSAPKPAEEPAAAKTGRRKREPVAAGSLGVARAFGGGPRGAEPGATVTPCLSRQS